MESYVVAVPSDAPGGLEAPLGQHFGHCDIYTLITVKNGEISGVTTLENVPHQQGGCMAPVNHLAANNVQVLVAGGMGMRPLMGFNQVGIRVFYGAAEPTVGAAVKALLAGRLAPFTLESTCGGGAH